MLLGDKVARQCFCPHTSSDPLMEDFVGWFILC